MASAQPAIAATLTGANLPTIDLTAPASSGDQVAGLAFVDASAKARQPHRRLGEPMPLADSLHAHGADLVRSESTAQEISRIVLMERELRQQGGERCIALWDREPDWCRRYG